jgi:hypothetical protein
MGLLDFFFRPLTPEKFAERFIREMHLAGARDDLVYDRENFRIVRGKPEKWTWIGLTNFYKEYLSLPRGKRRQHLVSRARMHVSKFGELPESFEEARSHLRPKLWVRAALEKLRLQVEVDGGEPGRSTFPNTRSAAI